jgi:peptidoglycan/xylan/chitin deacetylase (PgdA/CDA1 family)
VSSSLHRFVRRGVARTFAAPWREEGGLRILSYHRVNPTHPRDRLSVHPDAFAAQMESLARSGFTVLSLSRALPALRGEAALPARAVALTFDDGYADNLACAFPVLQHYGFPATFFIPTACVGLESTLDRYRHCCSDDRLLGWDEVRALHQAGHAIGGHGHTHRELPALAPEEARAEIETSARRIEEETGQRARLFCYPRGQETAETRRMVAGAGFEAACTVRPGANAAGSDLLALARTEVSADDGPDDFELKLTGGFDGWHRVLQGAQDAVRRVPW